MTSFESEQKDVVDFLSDPMTYGLVEPVEVITTHSAHVFLAGDLAFKIKRAVKYNYLDFTTLDVRRNIIKHELSLNASKAPQIYDRVVAITREASGNLTIDGEGDPVEFALLMKRFPRENELTVIADAGKLNVGLAEKLGATVAGFHAASEKRSADGAELIREILNELLEAFMGMEPVLGQGRLEEYFRRSEHAYSEIAPLLTKRTSNGYVRRCHGDLHLKNLVMIDGEPVPFDALEFDERLGTCDVFYDFAFLVMDMLHRDLATQANALLNSFLRRSGDREGLITLPLFLGIRAAIRSMVAVQTMSGAVSDDLSRDAQTYLDDAIRFLVPRSPRLIAIGGVSGSGKTTVAARLAPLLDPAPGAVHLRTDLERKAMFGVDPLVPLPNETYKPEVNQKVYNQLIIHAEEVLSARHSVIADATFLSKRQRHAIRALADRLDLLFDGIWLTAEPATLERRVSARDGDASDADVCVLHRQLAREAEPLSWTRVDAGDDPDTVVRRVEASLSDV